MGRRRRRGPWRRRGRKRRRRGRKRRRGNEDRRRGRLRRRRNENRRRGCGDRRRLRRRGYENRRWLRGRGFDVARSGRKRRIAPGGWRRRVRTGRAPAQGGRQDGGDVRGPFFPGRLGERWRRSWRLRGTWCWRGHGRRSWRRRDNRRRDHAGSGLGWGGDGEGCFRRRGLRRGDCGRQGRLSRGRGSGSRGRGRCWRTDHELQRPDPRLRSGRGSGRPIACAHDCFCAFTEIDSSISFDTHSPAASEDIPRSKRVRSTVA